MDGAALLEKIDAVIAELQRIRDEVAASSGGTNMAAPEDDLSPEHLLDTHAAASRFGYPQDTIRKLCRTEGLGVRQGGRWLVSVPKLQRRINGK